MNPCWWLESVEHFNSGNFITAEKQKLTAESVSSRKLAFSIDRNPWASNGYFMTKWILWKSLWNQLPKPRAFHLPLLLTHTHIYDVIFNNKTNTSSKMWILLSLSPSTFGLPIWIMLENNNLIHIWNEDINRFLSLFWMVCVGICLGDGWQTKTYSVCCCCCCSACDSSHWVHNELRMVKECRYSNCEFFWIRKRNAHWSPTAISKISVFNDEHRRLLCIIKGLLFVTLYSDTTSIHMLTDVNDTAQCSVVRLLKVSYFSTFFARDCVLMTVRFYHSL